MFEMVCRNVPVRERARLPRAAIRRRGRSDGGRPPRSRSEPDVQDERLRPRSRRSPGKPQVALMDERRLPTVTPANRRELTFCLHGRENSASAV